MRFLVVVWQHLPDLRGRGVVMQDAEHVGEPIQRIDAHDVAAFEKGVEYGVVECAPVVFAEQVVLAAQNCGALVALYGVVVDLVDPVVGIAAQARPQLVGIVEGFAHGVGRGALGGG